MSDVVIVGAKRTAIGSFLGQFTGVPTPQLGVAAITGALEQAGIAPDQVQEVIMGCVLPAGLGQAPARQAALGAGLPDSAACTTINKVCGSGMKAVMLGHDMIKAGSASVVVAGGMESMTNAPHLLNNSRTGIRYGSTEMLDHMAHDGLTNPYDGKAMGVFGDTTCNTYGFDREALDAFSAESVNRAKKAQADGAFKDEIVPVTVKTRKGEVVVDTDEHPRRDTLAPAVTSLHTARAICLDGLPAGVVAERAAHGSQMKKPGGRGRYQRRREYISSSDCGAWPCGAASRSGCRADRW